MLLVKSKELKNLNKKYALSPVLACLLCVLMFVTSPSVFAEGGVESITSPSSILSVFLSLLVVIAIIFALAYVMRRFNVASAGNGQMRVVASMMAGSKEKVMVIEVGDEQHLLGITANNINHLAKLETNLDSNTNAKQQAASSQASSSKQSFQQKLVTAMASGIVGATQSSKVPITSSDLNQAQKQATPQKAKSTEATANA